MLSSRERSLDTPSFTVALAEPDALIRGHARMILEQMGGIVVEVASGELLAALLDRGAVDLVAASDDLGDVETPDLLRLYRRCGGVTPFVILAHELEDVLWCAIELRGVSLVSTPFAADTLVAAVRTLRRRPVRPEVRSVRPVRVDPASRLL